MQQSELTGIVTVRGKSELKFIENLISSWYNPVMTREELLAKKRAYNKVYYSANKEKLVAYRRDFYKQNQELVKRQVKEYISRNKETVRQRRKNYYLKNRLIILKKEKERYEKLSTQINQRRRLNKDKIRAYEITRYHTNPQYRIAVTIRARIRDALKRGHKSMHTEELLGITFTEFKKYLESKFKKGMSWENYGAWEIDHIIPVSSFDLTSKQGQKKAFHYTNTQPLWAKENRLKCAKILI